MGVDNCLADGQPEPDATVTAGAAGVDTVEPVENARQVVGRNPDPGVGHGDDG
jgi:hypothetical protein